MRPTPRGEFRTRVVFEQPTTSRNEYKENVPIWLEVARAWAKVKSLKGQNLAVQQGSTIASTATHQVTIRYNADLVGKTTYRIRIGGGLSYGTLTAEEYEGLDYQDYSTLVATLSPPPRYMTINSAMDVDESKREINFTCTELVQ